MPPLTTAPPLVHLPLDAEASLVFGLLWRPRLENSPDPKGYQPLLQQTQCDHWIMHQVGDQCQYGLAAAGSEIAGKRLYSASLQFIDQLGPDWVAILPLPNQHYGLVGIVKGQVVPGCELVLATAAEALKQFSLYQALFQWQTVYAPPQLNLGGQSLELAALLTPCEPKAAYRLQYAEKPQRSRDLRFRYGIAGGVLLLLSAAGGYLYTRHQAALQLAQQQLRQAQRQKQTAQALPLWCQHPPAQLLVTQCMQAITRYPLFLGGWRLETVHCDRHSANASYRWQAPYTVKGLLAALQPYNLRYQFDKGGKVVKLQQPLNLPKTRPQEPLPLLQAVANELLQPLEQGIAVGRVDDLWSQPKPSASFELESDQTPARLLHPIPLAGVVIHSLHTTINPNGSLRWKCSGTLYGQ